MSLLLRSLNCDAFVPSHGWKSSALHPEGAVHRSWAIPRLCSLLQGSPAERGHVRDQRPPRRDASTLLTTPASTSASGEILERKGE